MLVQGAKMLCQVVAALRVGLEEVNKVKEAGFTFNPNPMMRILSLPSSTAIHFLVPPTTEIR
jgi:hypothetical protein